MKDELMRFSEMLLDETEMELKQGNYWIAYNVKCYYLENADVWFFKSKYEAVEFSDDNYSDYDSFWIMYADSLESFKSQLLGKEDMGVCMTIGELKELFQSFDWNEAYYDPLHDTIEASTQREKNDLDRMERLIDKWEELYHLRPEAALELSAEHWEGHPMESYKNDFLTIQFDLMIEKNYDYLANQLKMTGFGEGLKDQLKEMMTKNETQFTLALSKNYGNDETATTLHFKRPDDSEMYFFNRYSMMLRNNVHPDAIKQTFYINPEGGNITMKEAYNLMCGRAVHKELSTKEGEKYNAWLQLDFKETDKHGNHITKQFHQNYGYDLKAVLNKHPIRELANETHSTRLVESLERGNRQSVSLDINGSERKLQIEASPQFKSLNFYEPTGQRIKPDKLYESKSEGQSEKPAKEKAQRQGDGDDEIEGKAKGRRRRNNQGIS